MIRSLSILLACLSLCASPVYVDSQATGSNAGTSWTNAYTNINSLTVLTVFPDDIVYLSGGPSGNSRLYTPYLGGNTNFPIWVPPSGTAGHPITYQIGQDASHNGSAIFNGDGTSYLFGFQGGLSNVIFSGDAGDNLRHFVVSNYPALFAGQGWVNVRLSYVSAPELTTGGGDSIPGTGVEIDHCLLALHSTTADHLIGASFSGTNALHDNVVYLPQSASGGGIGSDGWQLNGAGGWAFYRNTNIAYPTNFTGTQHGDWLQTLGGANITIASNYFYGIRNYAIFLDGFGGFTNVGIYNNVLVENGGGIIAGVDGGGPATNRFDQIRVANNTIDCGTNSASQSLALGNVTGNTAIFTSCFVDNNIVVGGTAPDFTGLSNTPTNFNAHLTLTQATNNFTLYAAISTSNDYRPLTNSTLLVNVGTNRFSFLPTDYAGAPRPSSGAWTLGALLQLGSVGGTAPIVITGSVAFSGAINLRTQ